MLIDLRRLSVLFLGVVMLIASSCQSSDEREPKINSLLTISSEISPLRAYDTGWEDGDAIGVYAVSAGKDLQGNTIYNGASNVAFTTDGTGVFKAANNVIQLKAGKDIDLYAYYPYNEKVGEDFKLPLDVSDQSKPATIDLLYARSISPVSLSKPNAVLSFEHKLSQLVVTLVAQNGTDLSGVQATLDGTVVKGEFNLATGEVILGGYKSALSAKLNSESGGTASLSYLLLPGQTIESATITFMVSGRQYVHKIKASEAVVMESGYRYTYPFAISSEGTLVLLSDGAVIGPIENGGSDDVNAETDGEATVEELSFSANTDDGSSLTASLDIAAQKSETWSAVADHSFVTLTQTTTDGPGTLTITLEDNPSYEERTAKVTVTIVPKTNTAVATRAATGKRTRVINITQAGKKKPEADANLLLLDAPFAKDLEGFVGQSIKGDAMWHHSTYKGQSYAKISGYDAAGKVARANEDWLVSPQFDMTGATIAKLTFRHAINFASNMQEEATLYFSLDYHDDVKKATWIKVAIANYPSSNGWAFVPSGEILFPEEILGESNVHFAFKYVSTDANASTWEINNLQVKADAGKVIGVVPTPDPDPTPDPGQPSDERAHYMEIPIVSKNKMPDGYYLMHMESDSYFAGGHTEGGKRRNYTIYMAKNSRLPYWVAYPMYPDCMGAAKRTNAWGWDPEMPNEYQPDLGRSYTKNQSRGHMLASSARTATRELNKTTFYYSNMIPQYQTHNGGNWAQFENLEKNWGGKNDNDTIYVVTGPIFDPNTTNTCLDKRGAQIPIPTHSWKVMLRYDRSAQKYYSIAVKMPNSTVGSKWQEHVTTVTALEKELGVTFFTHLPKEVADEVKGQKDISKW